MDYTIMNNFMFIEHYLGYGNNTEIGEV